MIDELLKEEEPAADPIEPTTNFTQKELVAHLERWVNAAESDAEKESRRKGAAALLQPSGNHAKKSSEAKTVALYSPDRRGYRRASLEEGIDEQIKAMQAEAEGTPFFGEPPELNPIEAALRKLRGAPPPSKVTRDTREQSVIKRRNRF